MKKGFLKDYVLDPENAGGYRYVGTYYACSMNGEKRRKNGMLQMAGGLLEMLFLCAALSLKCLGNFKISVVIPIECILLCAMLYLTGSYAYRKSPDKMEKGTYEKAFVKTVQTVAIGLVLNVFAAAAQFVVVVRNAGSLEGYGDYLLLGMLLVLTICNLAALKYHRGLFKQAQPISVEAADGENLH